MARVSLSSRFFPYTIPCSFLLPFLLFGLVGCLLASFFAVHLWRVEHVMLLQSLPSVPPYFYGHYWILSFFHVFFPLPFVPLPCWAPLSLFFCSALFGPLL
jgi:hypothetical protein